MMMMMMKMSNIVAVTKIHGNKNVKAFLAENRKSY